MKSKNIQQKLSTTTSDGGNNQINTINLHDASRPSQAKENNCLIPFAKPVQAKKDINLKKNKSPPRVGLELSRSPQNWILGKIYGKIPFQDTDGSLRVLSTAARLPKGCCMPLRPGCDNHNDHYHNHNAYDHYDGVMVQSSDVDDIIDFAFTSSTILLC